MESKIIFKNLKWKNFLSYGNYFTEIFLDTKEITVLSGKNGSGKSVLLDAFYFCLTGLPLRDINKPKLLNSINRKNCIVELDFIVKNKNYKVIRGINPNIFRIYENDNLIPEDGKKVTFYQEKLNDIIGLTPETIRNILVINSTLKSFFKLSKWEKRKLIDDIFKLDVFNLMLEKVKEKLSEYTETVKNQQHELRLLESTLNHQNIQLKQYEEIVKSIKSNKDSQKNKIKYKITKLIEKNEKINIKLIQKEEKLKELKEKNKIEQEKETKRNNLISEINLFELKLKELPEIVETCNECGQKLPIEKLKELKDKNESEKNDYISIINENTKLKNKLKFKKQIDTFELENIIIEFKKQFHSNNNLKIELENDLKSFEEKLPEKPNINIKETETKIKELKKSIKSNTRFIEHSKIVNKTLLNGDLKTFKILNYIPFFNEQFNYFLELFNFEAKIKFTSELDWNIISAKYQNYSYDNFSNGEKLRINLALLFTFINLSKLLNFGTLKQVYNVLFLDEFLDNGLDSFGITDCLNILTDKNKTENLSIFIVSHKFSAENTDFFHYEAIKKGNFSKLIQKNS